MRSPLRRSQPRFRVPADLAATIFWQFGIPPVMEMHDPFQRPFRLAEGTPLTELF